MRFLYSGFFHEFTPCMNFFYFCHKPQFCVSQQESAHFLGYGKQKMEIGKSNATVPVKEQSGSILEHMSCTLKDTAVGKVWACTYYAGTGTYNMY